ncbi:MAG: hypothetical protein GEU73_04620 [Chloroflexi bacterium]|nr:hypothetical protein [Chloroflexota bacterium]
MRVSPWIPFRETGHQRDGVERIVAIGAASFLARSSGAPKRGYSLPHRPGATRRRPPQTGMLEAAMLRSPFAHALITRIDYSRALEIPGAHGVIKGADVAALIVPARASTYPAGGESYYIATDRVRFVGDILAAEDRYIAEDALDAIDVEYEELPVVSDPARAADADQPVLHPETEDGNEVFSRVYDFGYPQLAGQLLPAGEC